MFTLIRGLLAGLLLPLVLLPGRAQTDTARPEPTVPITTHPRTSLSPLEEPFPYGVYEHSIEFDSTTGEVLLQEELLGTPFGQPRTLTLEEYIQRRQEEQQRILWEERARQYKLTAPDEKDTTSLSAGALLDSLLKGGPSIKIPLPQTFAGIFGDPSVNIDVKGSVTLSAGWQIDNNNLTSISSYGSTQSAPFFDQNIQVAVTGKVGSKLKLSSDFDTQRSFDLDNQLKISFGGGPENDDDIIQGIEAGNVSLQTPSTLIGGSQTLFGVKAKTKFGKLLLTNILSQKRGERRVLKVSGGSVTNQIVVKPYEYAQNHFWLDTLYKGFYDEFYNNTPPSATPRMANFKVTDIEVYEQVKDGATPSQFEAIAYADLHGIQAGDRYPESFRIAQGTSTGSIQRGSFIRLERGRGYDLNEQLGIVTIRSLQRDKLYAVAYRSADGRMHGELSNTRPDSNAIAVLKLIYVNNMQPSFTTLWSRQMKNIYQLQGVRNVDLNNSTIRITYGVPPDTSEIFRVEGGKRIVTVLGVDRTNSSNQSIPDGIFDIKTPAFFDPVTGEIIFPSTEPFRRKLRQELGFSAEPFVLDAIYDQTRDEAQRDTRVGKYTISGEIAGTGGNRIALNTFNLAPGSVRVLKNGEALVEGVDYRLDPIVGQVTLISPRANTGGGDIEVEFEQNDLFTTSVKTLVGMRADYDLYSKRRLNSKIGMTLMRYGQSLPIDKIQIYSGEEPVLNTGIGFDGFVNYKAPFLTDLIDALPFIETDVPSEVNFSGEWAAMLPSAGTLDNLIDIDNGESVAYIDDFESGAKRQIQLGINYTLWHHGSPPIDDQLGGTDSARLAHKGLFWWYNRSPADILTRDIWPDRETINESSTTTVLNVLLDPARRGIYNPNIGYETDPPLDQTWGAMQRSLSFFTTNLNEENIDFVELTLNAQEFGPDTKVYLEMGQISEDVIPNFELDTEDGVTETNPQRDDVLNEGEDIGIDGLTGDAERSQYGINEEDPARDDYFFEAFRSTNPTDYEKVNGLEQNVGQERGPFPDTEDLNSNRSVDLDDSYFRYEINLQPEPSLNPQIVGSGRGNWRQYRIPLRTGYEAVGTPSFANVQYARLIIKSPTRTWISVAEMNLVGSDWRNEDLAVGDTTIDPKLDIAFVNLEDNGSAPDFYTLPPGVDPQINDLTGLRENEQSLAVTVKDLQRGESRGAIRVRPRSFDVFNYKKLRFFLHGAGDMDEATVENQQPKVIASIRFGWDSLNYYEYRVPLLRGWNPYEIDFNELAAIKFNRDGTPVAGVTEVPVPGKPGHTYAVRGLPSLTRIQFIGFAIENNAWPGALNTTMWVNELRTVQAQGGADWAATISASAKLADFANINYNASRFNPNFHRLEDRFGDRVQRTNWAFNSVFQFDKFLPEFMKGSTVPFTYNHVERVEHPLNIAESDVNVNSATERIVGDTRVPVDEAQRRADSLRRSTQTLVVQDALAFNDFKLQFAGSNWLIKDIVNNFKFGFAYDQRRERSPVIEQRFQWKWDFQGGYAVNVPRNFTLRPFKSLLDSIPVLDFWEGFEITFLPTQIGTSVLLHRERTTEKLRELPDPSPVIRDFSATRSANFSWPIIRGGLINPQVDYDLKVRSTLIDLETDSLGMQRSGSEIFSDLFLDEGRLLNFGQDNNMTQTFTFNSRPRIPFIPNADRFFTPSAMYKVDYQWDDQLGPKIGEGSFTKSVQYNSRSTLGMTIRLKQLGDVIFGDQTVGAPRRDSDSTGDGVVGSILRALIKVPLLDWDQFQLNFTQSNGAKNPGVQGGSGLSNIWGRSLLFRSESPDFGPGAAYQLGLIRYPHGSISFPWFGAEVDRGVRAPGIYVQDNYSQDNNLTANTSRQLIPGMTLTLNWNTRWGMNQNYSVVSDANGIAAYTDYTTTQSLSRTYLSLPIFFDNDIDGVVNEYAERKGAIPVPTLPTSPTAADSLAFNQALTAYNTRITQVLSETFEEKLEALSWLPQSVRSFFPRANWRIQWNGLEKLPFMSAWAQRASLTHEYRGQFVRNVRQTTDGLIPETQTVSRGFQPLIGINITGKQDFWKGTASASLNYNTSSDFALVAAARSEISQQLRNEMQLRLSYQRRGLKLSILGLDLKNEVEFTTDFSFSRQNTKRFNLTDFRPEGNNDGSTRISFRPAVRYTISRTVDATGFVSYEATIPDDEGSRDISRSTLKVGVDIRLKISGGR